MMKRLLLLVLSLSLSLTSVTLWGREKKNKKYQKQTVQIEQTQVVEQTPLPVLVTRPSDQMYGEWVIESLRRKPVSTRERPYLYLDFRSYKVYGNNGCNSLNGRFQLNGNNIVFREMVVTEQSCHNVTSERAVMKALSEVRTYNVASLYGVEYLNLMNKKGDVLLTLKRQNLDLLSGVWLVKELDNRNVSDSQLTLVIDPEQQTLHGRTGCNVINGLITIDTDKDFAVQFDDLTSTENMCDDMTIETSLLLALERTEFCKRVNDNEVALLDGQGGIVAMLMRTTLVRGR